MCYFQSRDEPSLLDEAIKYCQQKSQINKPVSYGASVLYDHIGVAYPQCYIHCKICLTGLKLTVLKTISDR